MTLESNEYKDYSLKQLGELVEDAINSNATPQEVRDSIVNTVREQIDYHLNCVERASEFLALLNIMIKQCLRKCLRMIETLSYILPVK